MVTSNGLLSRLAATATDSKALSQLLVLLTIGCKPNLEGRPSHIDVPRVLAIRSQLPEVRAADNVVYDVLLAEPIVDTVDVQFDWALCNARKPLAESGPIAQQCLQPTATELAALGGGTSATAQMPKDVCAQFGPLPPVQKPGEPVVRAEDPDTTGGYYQPVRLLSRTSDGGDEYEVGVTRLVCGLALGASQESTIHYSTKYLPNSNPSVDAVTARIADSDKIQLDLSVGAIAPSIPAGAKVQLEASWAGCSDLPDGDMQLPPYDSDHLHPEALPCSGAEAYLYYDSTQQAVVQRREAIRVSWYATAGNFEYDRTGRTEEEAARPSTLNTWTAPDAAANVRFWLVIRDDRRGIGWVDFDFVITK